MPLEQARGFITNYTVALVVSGARTRQAVSMIAVGPNETSATFGNLPQGRRYGATVTTWTSAGPGPVSQPVLEPVIGEQNASKTSLVYDSHLLFADTNNQSGSIAGGIIGAFLFIVVVALIGACMFFVFIKYRKSGKFSPVVGYSIK